MVKFFMFILFTVICMAIALLPELAMTWLWHLVDPTTEVHKILLVALFFVCGGTFCVIFAVGAVALWVAGVDAFTRSPYVR